MKTTAWLALAPLPAIAVGALVASRAGVSPLTFAPNAAAALVGGAALWILAARPGATSSAARLAPWLALAAIAASLLGPGSEGVHRWLALGPLRLHASAALAPWLLLGFTSLDRAARERATVAVLAVQLLHLAQPDAAQATALAAGMAPVLASRQVVRPLVGRPALLLLFVAAALAWGRLDHLPPVPHVEGILALALDQGAVAALGALLALGLALLPLAWPARRGGDASLALAAGAGLYLCGSVVAALGGHFPVPLLGAGAAPVLGWYGLAIAVRAQKR